MSAVYFVRPKADQDLDDQPYYFATEAGPALGHRFLLAAHEASTVLASQPDMGWHARLHHSALRSVRIFLIKGFDRILVLYRPASNGVEILRVVHASRSLLAFLRREGLE